MITQLSSRHRSIEFKKFLTKIDNQVPADLDVHLICDNLSTHKTATIQRWLVRHPRFHLHFTPTGSSWLNLVERWFAEITMKLIRRGVHITVTDLKNDINNWVATWNHDPRPYTWTKTPEEIFATLGTYCQRINDSGH